MKPTEPRVGVVTGAARGIGRATALAFARKGIVPIVIDLDGNAGQSVVAEIGALGVNTICITADVSDVASITGALEEAVREFGSVDILVNNAGILSTTLIADLTEDEWDTTLGINLKGTVFATQQALRYMVPRKWGRIINISSMAGRMGGISTGCAYTASKSALIGLTMRVAREVASAGVTVNAIAPGTAETEMVLGFTDEARRELEKSIPTGRLIDPNDIAETAAFLASDAARSITGAVIDINGGMFMG
jgi:NAD(P)-dependent dehydrogenase (short-subunit alcohol dehydrogenase family)